MDVGGKVISAAVFFNTGFFHVVEFSGFFLNLKVRDCNFDVAIRHSSC